MVSQSENPVDLIRLRIASTYVNTGVRGGYGAVTTRDHIGGSGSAVDHHPEVADIQALHNVGDPRKVD